MKKSIIATAALLAFMSFAFFACDNGTNTPADKVSDNSAPANAGEGTTENAQEPAAPDTNAPEAGGTGGQEEQDESQQQTENQGNSGSDENQIVSDGKTFRIIGAPGCFVYAVKSIPATFDEAWQIVTNESYSGFISPGSDIVQWNNIPTDGTYSILLHWEAYKMMLATNVELINGSGCVSLSSFSPVTN
jgi:hypothetical protein